MKKSPRDFAVSKIGIKAKLQGFRRGLARAFCRLKNWNQGKACQRTTPFRLDFAVSKIGIKAKLMRGFLAAASHFAVSKIGIKAKHRLFRANPLDYFAVSKIGIKAKQSDGMLAKRLILPSQKLESRQSVVFFKETEWSFCRLKNWNQGKAWYSSLSASIHFAVSKIGIKAKLVSKRLRTRVHFAVSKIGIKAKQAAG